MAARPCRPGNMAAVTNKESHMPLSTFMFKYKHRLWCISGRYFQLSNVNLYLLTFTAGLMPHCFSYLRRRCASQAEEGEKITTVFIQLSCRRLRFRCSPGEHRHRTTQGFLTKQLCKYKQDSSLSPYCCLRNRPFGSNGKLSGQDLRYLTESNTGARHRFRTCTSLSLFINVLLLFF